MHLELAIEAARLAGRVLLEHYRHTHDIVFKGERDITTEADLAAESACIELIRSRLPDSLFVSEESNQADQQDLQRPVWYIDPLDGTTNYARGMTGWSASVAAVVNGEIVCGAIYDPVADELFTAAPGQGAWLNGDPIHVSARTTLAESIVLMDWPRDAGWREQGIRYFARLVPQIFVPRSIGSAALALCYVAAGWADAYYQYTLKPWDVAAAALILAEAGGRATDMSGRPPRLAMPDWLASNGHLHGALLALDPLAAEAPAAQ
jgi:myo-inositol-1(or 4)-monophosphatase